MATSLALAMPPGGAAITSSVPPLVKLGFPANDKLTLSSLELYTGRTLTA